MQTPAQLANLRPAWTKDTIPAKRGRNAGTREKITKRFLKQLHDDWEKHGEKAIIDWRTKHLDKYMAGILSLVPKEATLNISTNTVLDELDADQLSSFLNILRQIAGPDSRGREQVIIEVGAEELTGVHSTGIDGTAPSSPPQAAD